MAAASILAIAAGAHAVRPAAAATIAYPNLQLLVPEQDIQIYHPAGAPKELRFTHIVANVGDGPLEILPVYDSSTQTAVGYQRLYGYDASGNEVFVSQRQITDRFYFDPAHGHYHFPLAQEGLYGVNPDGSIGSLVVLSPKIGFCIGEDAQVNLTLPHAPGGVHYSAGNCADPNAIRGLSVGWGDQYDWTDPGQTIDITNVPDGQYWFRSTADPNNNFQETDKTDNSTNLMLQIAGDSVRVVNPLPNAGRITFDQSYVVDGSGTITTPGFSTAGSSDLLIAFVASDGPATGGQAATVSGGGLAWNLVERANTQAGAAEVWSASASSQLNGITVTSTQTKGGYHQSLTLLALQGAAGFGAVGVGSGMNGQQGVTLTSMQSGSWMFGVGNDPDRAIYRTLGPNQTMLHQWVDNPGSGTNWVQSTSQPTPSTGTAVQLDDTLPCCDRWNFAGVEVLPAGPPTVPVAPTGVSASAGNGSATVSWTAPGNGGSPISKYTVTSYVGSTAQPSTVVTGAPPATSATISGLSNGTSYTFTVTASNAVGTGPPSAASNPVTPVAPTVPAAPTGVSASAGNGSATVSWTAPANGGSPISQYTVTPYVGTTAQPSTVVTGAPPATSATISGLSNGTSYTFTVTASNAVGPGPPSAASNPVTPTASLPLSIDQNIYAQGRGTVTTAGFSTAGPGEQLVAFVAADGPAGGGQTATVSGGGLVWSLVKRSNSQAGTAEIWSASASSQLNGATVTSTPASGGFDQALTVLAFKGATGVGNAAGVSVRSGAPSVTVTTSRAGSWVFGVGNDWDQAVGRTLGANQVMERQWVDSGVGDTFWVQATSSPTAAAGTAVVLNDTAPTIDRSNFTAVEVLATGSPNLPAAPSSVSASAGNGSATVSWTAPANGGSPISRYTVTPYVGSTAQPSTVVTGAPPATSVTVTGLSNGTSYTFTVTASNAVGPGPPSAASNSVTPTGPSAPGAPTGVSASAGNGSATVSWTAPGNGGSPIGRYTVTPYVGSTAQPSTVVTGAPPATSVTVTGLSNGTSYTFTVTATNGVGTGPPSAASNPVTPVAPTVPAAPTGVSASAGNGSATVSWTAPANGGSPISQYTVTPYVGSTAQPSTVVTGGPPATSATITGLSNGTSYTFTVTASNAVGPGPPSAASNPVTPTASLPLSIDQNIYAQGRGTVATTGFSTAGPGEQLVAFVAADGPAGGGQTVTVSGGGVVWSLVKRSNSQAGTAEIWSASASSQLNGATVTSTPASGGFDQALTVLAFKGATGVGNAAGVSVRSGAPSVTVTTSRAGSWVFGVGNDWDQAVGRTLGANQVMERQWVDSGVGDTFWVQATSSPTAAAGTAVVLNDTAPTIDRSNFTAVEVLAG